MAKAEIGGLPIKPVEPVVLTMSKEEAQVLVDVISMASGMPDTSRRGLIIDIMRALSSVGYRYNARAYGKDGDLLDCRVHFRERT
jgi:hypothetical protein